MSLKLIIPLLAIPFYNKTFSNFKIGENIVSVESANIMTRQESSEGPVFYATKVSKTSSVKGISDMLDKINKLPKDDYIVIHRPDEKSEYFIEEDISKYQLLLNSNNLKKISVGEGNLSINDKLYLSKKYFVFLN